MSTLRKTYKFIIPALIIILICFLANSSLNQHYHKLSTGLVVKHAHPYQKNNQGVPFQTHKHNSVEFFILDQISIVFFTFSLLGILLLPFFQFNEKPRIFFVDQFKEKDLYFLNNYHAPPPASL